MTIRSLYGTPPHHLLGAVAAILLAMSLWIVLRKPSAPEPAANADLYAQLGSQAAEKTLTLVKRGASVLIVEPRLFGHAAEAMQSMIHAYERALRKAGVSVAARERVIIPGGSDEPWEEPWTFRAMQEKHSKAGAIASFAGLPANPMIRGEHLPIIVFCPQPVDARAILLRGEASIVIAPRATAEKAAKQASDVYEIIAAGDPQ